MLTQAQAKRILREAKRRQLALTPKPINFFSGAFPQQVAALNDPAKLKVFHCPRRSAKSYTIGLGLFDRAYNNPGVKCFYVTVTRDMARNILWQDILKRIDHELGLKCEFNESLLEVRLPNKSSIRLIGIDTDSKQMRKLLGGKYKVVALDEVSFFYTDVEELVYKVAIPATADLNGEIWLASTSSDLNSGLFYDLTKDGPGQKNGWSVHTWSWRDNPYTCKQVQKIIDDLVAANPLIVETPHYQQHYENKWTIDDKNLVYRYNPDRNLIYEVPKFDQYRLGVDLGFDDATAFVVGAWSDTDKTLYIIETYKESGLDFTATAQRIQFYSKRYSITHTVIDGANKQGVEEMCNRHDLVLTPATKTAKWDYIRLMNADLITGRIKLHEPYTKDLATEWTLLIKDPNAKTPTEHPKCENHLCDAALYLWRECYNFLSKAKPPKKTKEELIDAEEAKMMEEALRESKDRKEDEDFYQVPDDYYKL